MNKVAKVATKYVCESCNYSTFKKSDFEKHLQTQKHKNRNLEIAGNEKVAKVAEIISCKNCERIFKSNSGLWKHNQICQKTVKHTESGVSAEFLTEFMLKQQQANAEMMKNAVVSAMKDIAPHMGNNNTTNSNNTNQFNIILF